MNRFKFTTLPIPGLILIKPTIAGDDRGFFMETFQKKEFEDFGLPSEFVQDNHSGSRKGILRGLHYQIKHPQGKLVRVIAGEVYDVAVDLRKDSETFGQWYGVYLSSLNRKMLWIPAGFAHGFYVKSDWAEFLYKTTDFYAPEWERTILWSDPDLAIKWPIKNDETPILSKKDTEGSLLKDAEVFSD